MMLTKRDLSRTSWCIVAFLTLLICATLSCAGDAMTICQRIQRNDLKIRTMGLVGDKFIVLTSEGHLFYLPKANLGDLDSSSNTLTIDQVPARANRVFGVELDYSIRHGNLFFLLVDGKSKSELLMTLQVESEQVHLQAFHLDWTRNHKGQRLNWTKEKDRPNFKFNFNPNYVANIENSECAEARRTLKQDIYGSNFFGKSVYEDTKYYSKITQEICLIGDSLAVMWTKELDSYEIWDHQIILTEFWVAQSETLFKINLYDDGKLFYWKKTKDSKPADYKSLLSNFIRCGPNFADNTHNLEPSEDEVVETTAYYKTTSTSTSQSSADKQTHHYGWIIATVFCLGIIVTLVCIILIKKMRKKKKNRDKKRIRNDKHSSLGSGVSTAIGSSNVSSVGSSASSCSNASSGASSGPTSALSSLSTASAGTSSGMTSSSSSSSPGSSAKATKSKHRSLMDTISSIFKKNQKKNAKQRSKVDKAKECKKKKKDGSKK